MAHPVTCTICGNRFDRDIIPSVQTAARRYAHASCIPDNQNVLPIVETKTKKKEKKKTQEDEDLKALKDYINQKYKDKANWVLIMHQIKQYKEENNYTYSGMLKSLIYFFDIQHNGIEKSNGGVGIIPFCYQPARDYYYSLWLAQQQNENKVVQEKEKVVVIKQPWRPNVFKKFFNLGEEDE